REGRGERRKEHALRRLRACHPTRTFSCDKAVVLQRCSTRDHLKVRLWKASNEGDFDHVEIFLSPDTKNHNKALAKSLLSPPSGGSRRPLLPQWSGPGVGGPIRDRGARR